MSQITSFRSVIELWGARDAHGSRLALASEIGASAGMVTKWWQRDWIPSEWWASILRTEKARSADVSAELLTKFAARREEARA
jgi:hypothetical protein